MNTRRSLLLSLVVWGAAAAAWAQYGPPAGTPVPPPPPSPDPAPSASPPSYMPPGGVAPPPAAPPAQVPYYPPPGSYAPPPGAYAPPPGSVMVAPGQPYPYPYVYAAPGVYGGPVVAAPPVVLRPAPPLASYGWSAAVDALFLERSSGGSVPLGHTRYNPALHLFPGVSLDTLYSDDACFPLAAGLRVELARRFDRFTLAGTYWGLQQWSEGSAIYGDPSDQSVLAYSPHLQLSSLLGGLDNSLGYEARSHIENAELNALYRLNAYDPYWELDWLVGARYVYFADRLTLSGADDLNGVAEQLDFRTFNNLVGPQTGLLFVRGWSRFQWELGLKLGLMANIYHQRGSDTASADVPGFTPYDISHHGSDLSILFELSLGARFALSDNLWFRLGYQFYDITGLALAPKQLGGLNHGGNVAFDGLSLGLQATW